MITLRLKTNSTLRKYFNTYQIKMNINEIKIDLKAQAKYINYEQMEKKIKNQGKIFKD